MSKILYVILSILYPTSKQGKGERNVEKINKYMERYSKNLFKPKSNKREIYIIDGYDSIESDTFNLGKNCLKLVEDLGDGKLIVVVDDWFTSRPNVYVIDKESTEILSELRWSRDSFHIPRALTLRERYRNVCENVDRGIIPKDIIDKRIKYEKE